jgi:hypothetical protein
LTLGGEIFHQTADNVAKADQTGFTLGGYYDFDEHNHLLFSAGTGFQNASTTNHLLICGLVRVWRSAMTAQAVNKATNGLSHSATLRHRPRRIGSARLAQEEESCCLNQNTKLDFGETAARLFLFKRRSRQGSAPCRGRQFMVAVEITTRPLMSTQSRHAALPMR